jgi:hypothetical protein
MTLETMMKPGQGEGPETESENVVCPSCVHEQPDGGNFCVKCGSPLSSFAGFGPMERILFEGSAYRRVAFGPSSRIVLIGMWLVLGLPVSLVFVTIGVSGDLNDMLGGIALPLLSGGVLYRVTRNYFRQKKQHENDTGSKMIRGHVFTFHIEVYSHENDTGSRLHFPH